MWRGTGGGGGLCVWGGREWIRVCEGMCLCASFPIFESLLRALHVCVPVFAQLFFFIYPFFRLHIFSQQSIQTHYSHACPSLNVICLSEITHYFRACVCLEGGRES